MSEQHAAGGLTDDLRDLLTAISETLTLPRPAGELTDLSRYEGAVAERMHLVRLAIKDVLSGDGDDLRWEAAYLRKKSATPVRYRTPEQWLTDLKRIATGSTDTNAGKGADA